MFSGTLFVESIFAFFWALVICVFAVPRIITLSFRKKLLDEPDGRHLHKDSTPRLGGLAIFAGFFSAVTIFGKFTQEEFATQQILAGTLLLLFAGVKDDIVPITPIKKFFMQLLATSVVVFVGGIRVTSLFGFLGIIGLENIGISYAFTFVVIIGITNSINLIDGLNGLAGSLSLLMALVFGMLFYELDIPITIFAFALAGGVLGFLRYNFVDGKIFMGDSGSLVIGFLLAVMAVLYLETDHSPLSSTPQLTISILIVPLFDTLRVSVIRLLDGRSPFEPDNRHIHHTLMNLGLTTTQTVLLLVLLNALMIGLVYFLPLVEINLFVFTLTFVLILLSFVLNFLEKKSRA